MRFQLAILSLAALLAPRKQRREWTAEWSAELWYVCQASKPATAFCLGAFKDALWLRCNTPAGAPNRLRLDSPFACLFLLTILAAVSVLASRFDRSLEPVIQPTPTPRNLVLVSHVRRPVAVRPTIRLAEFQTWTAGGMHLFTDLAFYQPLVEPVAIAGHPTVRLSVARSTANLFQLLHIPVPGPATGARLILSQRVWNKYFAHDPRIVGTTLDIAGQSVRLAGAIPELSSNLPGRIDAWLLEDPQSLATLPPDATGFVLARTRKSPLQFMSVPNPGGGYDWFDCVPLSNRTLGTIPGFLLIVVLAGVLLPVVTPLSLGEYPKTRDVRRWIFLAAKLALILLIVYCSARFVVSRDAPVPVVLLGCVIAFRWILIDQRRRCPACLRLLAHPVRIGRPSQTFLEWYGTELMCTQGHGLLHVAEIPTSCYSTQRWMYLDRSWTSLFS